MPAVLARTPTTLTIKTVKQGNKCHQHFDVYNSGDTSTITFTLASNKAWLTPSAAVYTCTNTHRECTATYDVSDLSLGKHTATITVAAEGLVSVTIAVSVTVEENKAARTRPKSAKMGVGSIKRVEASFGLPLSGGRKGGRQVRSLQGNPRTRKRF